MKTKTRQRAALLSCCLATLSFPVFSGCAHLWERPEHRQNASVVDFLFPGGTEQVVEATVPTLKLPIDVGVAFVPARDTGPGHFDPQLSEERKVRLLKEVAREFDQYKFVRKIETIPSNYLRPQGGFENLDQLARMFGVQVIALVSYDQVQFTDEDFTSFAYWTIVGAYMVEGEKNDTQTLLDAVVYDVSSRSLLFRAPGVSRIEARSTPVNLSEELRDDAHAGFEQAATNLVLELKAELARFQERVRDSPQEVKVVARPGYVGGGAFGRGEVIFLLLLAAAGWLTSRNFESFK